MNLRKLGCKRHRGLGDQPRLVADVLGRRRARAGEGVRGAPRSTRASTSSTRPTCTGAAPSETLLGEVLSDHDRSSYVLATKVFFPMSDTDRGLSAAQIHKQIDASLAAAADRLRRPVPVPPLRLAHAAGGDDDGAHAKSCARARRAISASASGLRRRSSESLALPGVERWVSSQPQYSMLWRAARGGGDPAVRTGGDLPDRVVPARAGRAHRQVPSRGAAAAGFARGERQHERHSSAASSSRACSRRFSGCRRSPTPPG